MAVYSIKNNCIEVKVNSKGAELNSLLTSEGTELLWQASKDVWPRYAPVLFPIVGRLKNNLYNYKDNNYSLSQHGFARDKEFILVEHSDNTLKFELTADESKLELYPFHFSLIISYTLNENVLDVTYQVFNPDNKELLFSIGAHPGFSTCRKSNETLGDFILEFPNKTRLIAERLDDGLLSGHTYEIQLNSGCLPLSTELFNNDALVFKNSQIEKVLLKSKKTKEVIELSCKNWPYFGIWTKKGSDEFVCLEPWFGITDSAIESGILSNKEGIIVLEPKKQIQFNYSLSFL